MGIFVFWIAFSIGVAVYAAARGRSGVGYFFLSALLSPLIGLIVLLVFGENKDAVEQKRIASGQEVKCFFCAELIKSEAKICKHCAKPNHPVYHGQRMKIEAIDADSLLQGTRVKPGDYLHKYDGKDLQGRPEELASGIKALSGAKAKLIVVRDAEEIETEIPPGLLGVNLQIENQAEPVLAW